MRFSYPLISLAAIGYDHAEAGPGEMEAVDSLAGAGDLGEDFFAGGDGDLRVVIEVDEPFGVFEHEHVVVCEVGDVQERFALGFDAEDRVAVGVTRGGEDGDRTVEDLVAVFVDDEIGLQGIEGVADIFDHRGDIVRAVGFGKVGFLGAPEVEFFTQHVDGGVGEKDVSSARETADVVDVRVAQQGVGYLGEGDADGIHRIGKPAPCGFLVRAEAGVDQDDLLVLAQQQDVDIKRHVIGAFPESGEGLGHLGSVGRRPHLVGHAFRERAVAVADRPGFEFPDGELVDVGVGNRFFRDRLACCIGRGFFGGQRGRKSEGGEGRAQAPDEIAA